MYRTCLPNETLLTSFERGVSMQKSDDAPIREAVTQLWLALVLLTRLPLPRLPERAFANGARAVWAYPLVGICVGAAGALVGQLCIWAGLPQLAAATLTIATMMLMTGAMHEDGLADVCDGFWGGFTSERRLEIMRDSQIGTYGVLGLAMITLLRVSAVSALLSNGFWAIVVAAIASRAVMPLGMYALPHARRDGLSQSVGRPPARAVAIAAALGGFALWLLLGLSALTALFFVAVITTAVLQLAKRKIGGQTGDVLGAIQQLSEVALLLICASLL